MWQAYTLLGDAALVGADLLVRLLLQLVQVAKEHGLLMSLAPSHNRSPPHSVHRRPASVGRKLTNAPVSGN